MRQGLSGKGQRNRWGGGDGGEGGQVAVHGANFCLEK